MMVDNLGKNMMIDTWDNKIFYPRFYDCDTICSYDNSGQLKFDVDIEMAQGYWNTSSSRLWTRVRDLFHDELVETYNTMRKNGMSYETFMECFYDEQIAKIPQKYYNMDFDVKYAPFADSYLGMANGDTYEHLKRWLKQRIRFVDTLYDYAPSYNNDMLTIRANTTELMTLEIETYTPVYQHLSWYNNQMDKKKIDGKTSVTFTGKAMAATDQEVLIYGGSNIKSIKGISSMNPNRMLIGSATKLVELEAPNCPLLADVNANKANFAPHVYLNKLDISNCPMLGGNLIVNNSPLLREIDIRGTAITGLNLPANLRNLEILKLPAAISNLMLNDASQLHTLEFEDGVNLQNVSMTNCISLANFKNFNLEGATSITLNNSYNIVNELYLNKTTNLSVSNMPILERVIFTPNAEHEVFDKTNIDNASNYTISTFNCPKLNEFITTAPYRESYGKEYGEVKPNEVFEANSIDISNTQFTDVKLLCTTDTNVLKLPATTKNLIVDSAYDLDTNYLTDGNYYTIHTELYEPYNTDYEGEVLLNGETPNIIPSASDGSIIQSMYAPAKVEQPAEGVWDLKGLELEQCHTFGLNNDIVTSKIDELYKFYEFAHETDVKTNPVVINESNCRLHMRIVPEEAIWLNVIVYPKNGSTINAVLTRLTESYDSIIDLSKYIEGTVCIKLPRTFVRKINEDNYFVGNALKPELSMPDRYDEYSLSIKNRQVKNEVARYTASDWNTFPTFNSEFTYTSSILPLDNGTYAYSILADSMDNLPTSISFNGKSNLLTVEYLNVDNVTDMSNMFNNCTNLTSLDVSNFDTSNVVNMGGMFRNCTNLTTLDLSNFDTKNITDMSYMFYGCNSLTSLDVSNWDTSKVTTMCATFANCSKLQSLDTSNWDTSSVTNMYSTFQGCSSLQSLDVSNWDTSKVTTMQNVFYGCSSLQSLDVSNWKTGQVANMYGAFAHCSSLQSLDVSNWKTSSLTNMFGAFAGCSRLQSLDLSNWDTSKVDNISSTFANCSSLQSLDLSKWVTSSIKNMTQVFFNCSSLQSLDVGNWDTGQVTDMKQIFNNCSSLQSLDVSNWKTGQVTTMYGAFAGCSRLQSLDLSNWNTSKVTSMYQTFYNCNNLISLDSMQNIPVSLSLSSTKLDQTSLVDVINNLATVTTTQTLTLDATLLAKLTEEQIAVAVNKGWTVQ